MRLLIAARHAHSTLNLERRINGDPSVQVDLTPQGVEEARELGVQLANVRIDLCVHTRFARTRDTAVIALEGREVELRVEPLFDDIDVGDLEGLSIERYREWKAEHRRSDPFPAGESLDDAARRYARAYRELLDGEHATVLVVYHEIPLRYALNAALGSHQLDGPVHELGNAMPYLFDEDGVRRAIDGIERLASADRYSLQRSSSGDSPSNTSSSSGSSSG